MFLFYYRKFYFKSENELWIFIEKIEKKMVKSCNDIFKYENRTTEKSKLENITLVGSSQFLMRYFKLISGVLENQF